ncbi:hypothetical protein FJTKL_00369 [Diaporthe vaccinii]|uniref:Uncharacterized protein n=1 Tax=Diaporthe vaccinii TaxID=105482 RepID=A0ABR4E3B2_9PEZI
MSARNLTALGFSVGIGVITGVYIFKPTLQEQSEFWRNPGEAKLGSATDSINMGQQDLKNQPPNRQGQGQEK